MQGRKKTLAIFLLLATGLSSCSPYQSHFACGSAKGVPCSSMERVNQLIDSGEIEQFNEPAPLPKRYLWRGERSAGVLQSKAGGK